MSLEDVTGQIRCDRCGGPAVCLNGSADSGLFRRGAWAIVRVLEQGTGRVHRIQLRRSCGEEPRAWAADDPMREERAAA